MGDDPPANPGPTPSEDPTLDASSADFAAMMGLGLPDSGLPSDAWTPPDPAWLNDQLDGYEVYGLLGRGGMGAVYRARQVALERDVAVKVLAPTQTESAVARERFIREARMLAQLHHPRIVAVHDFGELEGGLLYLVMELVESGNLMGLLAEGPCPPARAVEVVVQLCAAVAAAHHAGLVHRDIKPANILLTPAGHVKLADFGVARSRHLPDHQTQLTSTGSAVGTLAYIAPELLEGATPDDPRSDVYSIGVVLYKLLTTRLPRGAFEPVSQTPGVPAALDPVVSRALQADPDARYPSAPDLAQALEQALHRPPARRPAWIARIAGAAAALGLIAAAVWIADPWPSPPTLPPAHPSASPSPAPPAAAPRSQAPPTTPAVSADPTPAPVAADGWVSLMGDIDLNRDVVDGGWQWDNGQLVTNDQRCVLQLPVDPPYAYDVRLRFVRLEGRHSVAIYFQHDGEYATAGLDAWEKHLGGIQYLDGKDMRLHGEAFHIQLQNGRPYEMILSVRPNEVRILVDGELRQTYDLTGRRLHIEWHWRTDRPIPLGIGSWESPTAFESIEWRVP